MTPGEIRGKSEETVVLFKTTLGQILLLTQSEILQHLTFLAKFVRFTFDVCNES